jgi:putative flavoprotein involved in K+ transport
MWWVLETGFFDQQVEELPTPAARLGSNVLATGRNGGHDLHLRTLRAAGVTLLGRFLGADGQRARFADDLGEERRLGRRPLPGGGWPRQQARRGAGPAARRLWRSRLPSTAQRRRSSISPASASSSSPAATALTTAGWMCREPSTSSASRSTPTATSSAAEGLYFVGVHFLRTRKSSLLCCVAEDAAIIARQLARFAIPQA